MWLGCAENVAVSGQSRGHLMLFHGCARLATGRARTLLMCKNCKGSLRAVCTSGVQHEPRLAANRCPLPEKD
jgi:hypothetical protein